MSCVPLPEVVLSLARPSSTAVSLPVFFHPRTAPWLALRSCLQKCLKSTVRSSRGSVTQILRKDVGAGHHVTLQRAGQDAQPLGRPLSRKQGQHWKEGFVSWASIVFHADPLPRCFPPGGLPSVVPRAGSP